MGAEALAFARAMNIRAVSQDMVHAHFAQQQQQWRNEMKKDKLEALEVRIDMLKQDSRLISYRITALEERRHEIQDRIKGLKQRAKRAK